MKVFIVATPLFDNLMSTAAYHLISQSGDKALSVKNDFRGKVDEWRSPGLDLVEKVGVEPFAEAKPLFVEINRFQLLMGLPARLNIPPENLVCLLPGSMHADGEVLDKCRELRRKGYVLALDAYPADGPDSAFMLLVDYLFLNYKKPDFAARVQEMTRRHPKVKLVITAVPDLETYQKLGRDRDTRRSLFSGAFYRQPITQGSAGISPLKINALQLLRHVNEEDFDLSDITRIIERDPALSISLLRFINSSSAGLSRKVDSIQSAVAIMGQQEVRRWATVAISVNLAEDRPGEVTRISLIRAKFAENLAGAFELGVFANNLFMAGLFSLLDVILQLPMEEAIQQVAVEQRVKDALLSKTGELYKVLELIYAYERAEWDKVSIIMIQSGTDIEAVSTAFVDAIVWYDGLLSSIDEEETADGQPGPGAAPTKVL